VLDTPAFREAWAAWLKHKRERREKMTPTAQSRALKVMAGWTDGAGPAVRAVAAIDHSLARNWQGIFEARNMGRGGGAGRPASAQRKTPADRGEYCRPMPARVREL
jgi:hypothetical protein